ncbi:hypothetical protein DiNV_CH01M_ORF61 [Drosophila innubila nudivirus]|uniref:Uncharacterized protein n=1 Tax=Drosophila innubila nudivirus TaxID=2057187 RepID=A0A2H4UXA0_9VIRU|nr:hypothetical protein DiNV_CH01M_ORF61 [Drosophila innubila nudivirus]ATZ81547.1 hypothetical protein DiNV_CH01M_ORF61 [Drosophila innubila nudivirus]
MIDRNATTLRINAVIIFILIFVKMTHPTIIIIIIVAAIAIINISSPMVFVSISSWAMIVNCMRIYIIIKLIITIIIIISEIEYIIIVICRILNFCIFININIGFVITVIITKICIKYIILRKFSIGIYNVAIIRITYIVIISIIIDVTAIVRIIIIKSK